MVLFYFKRSIFYTLIIWRQKIRRTVILGFVLLAACSGTPEPTATAEPTATEIPTNTPEPTATATFTPEPTDTPTATPEPVPGIPLPWMLLLIETIQEVEPNATYVTGACSDPEYSEFEECVISVDFCPEGDCDWVIMVIPKKIVVQQHESPLLGNDWYLVVYSQFFPSERFLWTEPERQAYWCASADGSVPGRDFGPFAAWQVSQRAAIHLLTETDIFELNLQQGQEKIDECFSTN